MASKKPLARYTSPNKVQEITASDTIDPVCAGLNAASTAFVGTKDTQTVESKTLKTTKIDTTELDAGVAGGLLDANGNRILSFKPNSSAVDYIQVRNAASGGGTQSVDLETAGSDTNIHLDVKPKGSGELRVNGSGVPTASSTTTFTNKTLTSPRLSDDTSHSVQGGSVTGGAILDASGRVVLGTYGTGTGTYLTVRNNATTATSTEAIINLYATSSDSNVGIKFRPKGTGKIYSDNTPLLLSNEQITDCDYNDTGNWYPLTVRAMVPLAQQVITVAKDTLQFIPFFAPRRSSPTISDIVVGYDSTNAAAGNMRIGIYTNQSSISVRPATSGTALVSGSEQTFSIGTSGADTAVAIGSLSISLTGGALYWLAVLYDTNSMKIIGFNASVPTLPVMGALGTTSGLFAASPTYLASYGATYTYAALPANSTSAGVGALSAGDRAATGVPVIGFKFSS